ncbi:hypothetical protein ANN_01532 [Periplaneta americana]|uniref:Uncharacterized protein n=1 Tax=Periplaneta americana TaxID=6978 RepID=A0ABQ8TWU4_PERAM|nr:hypothetical protein ANN_01532 [Periplaneta americana]
MKPSLVQRHTRIGLYKTLAQPVLSYGSEAWTVKNKDVSRITASQMRFMRATAGYTRWDHKKNEDLMQELQIEPIMQFISKYQLQWKGHLERMNRCRIPKALLHYHPYGKRSLGRPKKRWTENSKTLKTRYSHTVKHSTVMAIHADVPLLVENVMYYFHIRLHHSMEKKYVIRDYPTLPDLSDNPLPYSTNATIITTNTTTTTTATATATTVAKLFISGRQHSLKLIKSKQCIAIYSVLREKAYSPAAMVARVCCKRPAVSITPPHSSAEVMILCNFTFFNSVPRDDVNLVLVLQVSTTRKSRRHAGLNSGPPNPITSQAGGGSGLESEMDAVAESIRWHYAVNHALERSNPNGLQQSFQHKGAVQ